MGWEPWRRTGFTAETLQLRLIAFASQLSWRVVFVAVLTVGCILIWRATASLAALGFLAAIDFVFAIWLLHKRGSLQWVGPLFIYELARLARRGRTTLLRCAYAFLLLIWLCILAADRVPGRSMVALLDQTPSMSVTQWADFARTYGIVILSLQASAVLVLTPAYLAGAIAEEKEKGTLVLLFSTDLRDREIVVGKMFGRLFHLATILLAAMPIFALTRLWGGVDDDVLLAGFAVSTLTMLSIGGISILCSVLFRSVLSAVVSSYGFVFVLNVCCLLLPTTSPLLFVAAWDKRVAEEWNDWYEVSGASISSTGMGLVSPGMLTAFPPPNPTMILAEMLAPFFVVHIVIFVTCTIIAIRVLRDSCLLPGATLVQGVSAKPQFVLSTEPLRRASGDERWHPPAAVYRPKPVSEPALLWKEMIHGVAAAPGPRLVDWLIPSLRPILLLFVSFGAGSLILTWLMPAEWSTSLTILNVLVRVAIVVLPGAWCILLAFRVAGCVSRERDQRTLDSLLAIPIDREEILRAKWVGSILRYRQIGYGLAAACAFGIAVGALHPFAVPLLAALCCVHLTFLASLGLWLSVSRGSTLRANMSMAFVLLVLFSGPWIGLIFGQPFFGALAGGWLHAALETRMAPGQTWWYTAFSWAEFSDAIATNNWRFRRTIIEAIFSVLLFGAAAWVFWRMARRRFCRDIS